MSEQGPTNPEIERIITEIPSLVKFVHLNPGEELLIRKIDSKVVVSKTTTTETGHEVQHEMSVSRAQMDQAKQWYALIQEGTFTSEGIMTLLRIGSNLIDVANALPPKPTI